MPSGMQWNLMQCWKPEDFTIYCKHHRLHAKFRCVFHEVSIAAKPLAHLENIHRLGAKSMFPFRMSVCSLQRRSQEAPIGRVMPCKTAQPPPQTFYHQDPANLLSFCQSASFQCVEMGKTWRICERLSRTVFHSNFNQQQHRDNATTCTCKPSQCLTSAPLRHHLHSSTGQGVAARQNLPET